MARTATVDALRKRGVAKKTAEVLADAGFTLESLAKSNPARLKKFIPEKDAVRVLQKLGAAISEKVQEKAPEKAASKPRKPAPRGRGRAPKGEAAGEEEAPPTIPEKAPPLSKGEQEIFEGLKEVGRYLPRALVTKLAEKTHGLKISKKKLHDLLERVSARYEEHRIDPNESAGIVSAQSIGEPGTQMSLAHDERVVVRDESGVHVVPIGELVDSLFREYGFENEGDSDWCDVPAGRLEVPSLTEDGRLVWKGVRAASRHTTDGPLLRLRTRTGREIRATPNHSFVTRRDGAIVPVLGSTLRPGDRVPVVRRWGIGAAASILDLEPLLPKGEYWYGSELAKARELGPRWREGYGETFVVPVGPEALARHLKNEATFEIEDGFVYPYQQHSRVRLPERIPLGDAFGWLVGAYLSEGWAGAYHVNISNTNGPFLDRTRGAANHFRIRYSEHENPRGFAPGHDLHMNSVILSRVLRLTCGSGSATKRVPDFAYGASDGFVGALLRAYFEGDGNVTVAREAIRTSSNSKDLIDGVALLLARFGILGRKGRTGRQHTLWIPARYARAFRDAIGFESTEKRRALAKLCSRRDRRHTYESLDVVAGFGSALALLAGTLGIPGRTVRSFTRRQVIGRATLERHLRMFEARARATGIDVSGELRGLRELVDEDVVWDEIVEVSHTSRPDDPVYDLSVPGLETFTTADGVVTHNTMRTFHYAGVAEMNVTLGLPRLIEIVDARRVPSTPIMEIHIKEGARDLDKIRRIAQEIEMTNLEDIADIETDLVNMQVLIYPDDHRMKVRGVTFGEVEERLKRFAPAKEIRRTAGGASKSVRGFAVEAGEPSFKKLQRLLEQMKGTRIKGIDGIRRAIIRRRGERYVIYTEGSNLAKVFELPAVDPTQTSTNSIQEIFDVLGVEAARNAIVKEANDTLQEQGLAVDIRHIMLVADMMTNDGDVKAIGRHGISGRKSSVLARAAFEITAHHLLHAAITGEVDALDGVAENVIVGQPVTLGTGAVNLVYRPPSPGKGKEKAEVPG